PCRDTLLPTCLSRRLHLRRQPLPDTAAKHERNYVMSWHQTTVAHFPGKLGLAAAALGLTFLLIGDAGAQTTFGGNAQHTANYTPAAQNLNAVHWTTSIDLNNSGGFAHYGAPLITPANTIFVPVKTGRIDGF